MDFASNEVVDMGPRTAKLPRNFAGCQNLRNSRSSPDFCHPASTSVRQLSGPTARAAARTGTITISFSTGQTATLTVNEDALSSSLPTLALLNPPPNGVYPSSTQQTFTFQATSPNGLAYINHMEFEINNTINAGGDDCRADSKSKPLVRPVRLEKV